MNIKRDRFLKDVLRFTRLEKLPSTEYKKSTPWMKAIVETLKSDGSEGYCVVKTIDGENFRVIKDFGTVSPIVKYGKFYPYSSINGRYLPSAKNRKELVEYLSTVYKDYTSEQIDSMSDDDIKKLVYMNAVDIATENGEYEERMYEERKKYVAEVKSEEEALEESHDEDYLKKKDELINYQNKVKDETKKQRKTRRTAKKSN